MTVFFWRRLTQCAVALAFIALPVLNFYEVHHFFGNFLSFNFAGFPLADPLAVAQAAAGSGSVTRAMLIGAGSALLFAALLGPVFCSWVCPFGFLSELVHPERRPGFTTKGLPPVSAVPFLYKALLAAAGAALVALLVPVPFLNQLSMPGWYSRFFQHLILYREFLTGAVLCIFAILLAERIARRRFWCRYCCPQSVLISLAGFVLPWRWRVRFAKKSCTCSAAERACLAACGLDLDPRSASPAQRLQCTNCGDCVDACKGRGGALRFGIDR